MKNYSQLVKNQGQTQPILGKKMVKNNAGGYGFEITPQERLERFLLIGSEGGTYYAGEKELTKENAEKIIEYIKEDGLVVVDTVRNFAKQNRAPKADAGIFVLALATAFGDEKTKQFAYNSIADICKTSTHLFMLLANLKNLRGWSRGLRKGIASFYTEKTEEQLAYQMVKYRNRAGYTHRDAIRLSHPKGDSKQSKMFGYAVGKKTAKQTKNDLVIAFEEAQNAEITTKTLVGLIKEYNLTWEMIPTEKLNEPKVLEVLLDNMQLTALIRNLNRFANTGLTEGNSEITKSIVDRLTDESYVSRSGIHPLNVVNAMKTYESGHGFKGGKTWEPNQKIVDALCETYELALKHTKKTGKNILVGVDVSGSMDTNVGGTNMTAAQISNVLALTMLKTEPNVEVVNFDTGLYKSKMGKRTSLDTAIKDTPRGGGTDCSLPIIHALQQKNKYDAVVILTDSETWAGNQHPIQALEQYRKSKNKNIKIIEVALTATGHSTMPNDDKNIMRVVGFDSAVTEVINNFLKD